MRRTIALLVAVVLVVLVTVTPADAVRASSLTRLEGLSSRHGGPVGAAAPAGVAPPAPAAPKPSSVAQMIGGRLKKAAATVKKDAAKAINNVETNAKSLWNRASAAATKAAKVVSKATTEVVNKATKVVSKAEGAIARALTKQFDPVQVAKAKVIISQIKGAFATLGHGGKAPPRNTLKKYPAKSPAKPASVVAKYVPSAGTSLAWNEPIYAIMKEWSNLAYDPVPSLRAWNCNTCKQQGLTLADQPFVNTHKSFFANTALTATTAATSSLGKAVVIAFAGTDSVGNWMTDAHLQRRQCSGVHSSIPGQCHAGFFDTILAHKALLAATVEKSKACGPSCTVYVTGHSLGGALATLAAAYLVNVLPSNVHIKLYTIASPRVGDIAFATWMNEKVRDSWRVVDREDPVPHVPFASALVTDSAAALDLSNPVGIMMEAWSLFGHKGINDDLPQEFFHVSNEAWWTGTGWKYCAMPESKHCSLSINIDLADAEEHMIDQYPN